MTESFEVTPEVDLSTEFETIANDQNSSDDEKKEKAAYKADTLWREVSKSCDYVANRLLFSAARTVDILEPFQKQGEIKLNKQQPSFAESFHETEKRLNFLRNYLDSLPPQILGVVSGGSMSYGRFYNVRGNYPDSSDLDLILVTDGPLRSSTNLENIVRTDLGFQPDDVGRFEERIKKFRMLYIGNEAEILSQKFSLPEVGFDISMHLMPMREFDGMLTHFLRHDLRYGTDVDVRFHDYKPAPFVHRVFSHRDFLGRPHPIEINERRVNGGVISDIPSYAIFDGLLVPGMYHNLCSPLFEVALDRDNTTLLMAQFKEIMKAAVWDTRKTHPNAELSNSHIRHDIFSSHIIAEANKL